MYNIWELGGGNYRIQVTNHYREELQYTWNLMNVTFN